MYQEKYYIAKISGFYQETLEAYGLSRLLNMILNSNEVLLKEISIKDLSNYYEIEIEKFDLSTFAEKIESFCRNPQIGFEYLFKQTDPRKGGTAKPKKINSNDNLDIPMFDIGEEWEIVKEYNPKDTSENTRHPNKYFNVYELFSHFAIEFLGKPHLGGTKQGGSFTRNYLQLYYNQMYFRNFVDGLLFLYSSVENQLNKNKYQGFINKSFPKKDLNDSKITYHVLSKNHKPHKSTFNQLTTPNASKGNNSVKLRLSEYSEEPELLREYVKTLGCFESMVSIGGNKSLEDYRVYVSAPKDIEFLQQKDVMSDFRKAFYTNSTYKGDIISSLLYAIKLIEHLEISQNFLFDFDYSPSNFMKGFYVCHFMTIKKSPPKKHAPINLSFIWLPKFIKATNKEVADIWIEITSKLINIIKTIRGTKKQEETGDTIHGLSLFRDFISTSQIDYFFKFSFWYADYIMRKLIEKDHNPTIYIIPFRVSMLNQFYTFMETEDMKLTEIIYNEGFLAVAKAIRNSTVSLQYSPKDARKYEVRYGLAQKLQNKSKTKNDLCQFIGEFIGQYNSETAMKKDTKNISLRANVKEEELNDFFGLLENWDSKIIGALLASYGFALHKKEESEDELAKLAEKAEKLGYTLEKIEETSENNNEEEIEEN